MAEQSKKKVAVVTGASRGIGRAIALELASRGAAVVINYNGSEERAKEVQKAQKAIEEGNCPLEALPELKPVMDTVRKTFPDAGEGNLGVGSTIFAVKPGDGSAREQAASCQRVIGGLANIVHEYATKRYRSNVMNWGMVPFQMEAEPNFEVGDYVFVPGIRAALDGDLQSIVAYVVRADGSVEQIELYIADMTAEERAIVKAGCLINYNKFKAAAE